MEQQNNYLVHWYNYQEDFIYDDYHWCSHSLKWYYDPLKIESYWQQNFERLWSVTENQVKQFCEEQNIEKIWYETI